MFFDVGIKFTNLSKDQKIWRVYVVRKKHLIIISIPEKHNEPQGQEGNVSLARIRDGGWSRSLTIHEIDKIQKIEEDLAISCWEGTLKISASYPAKTGEWEEAIAMEGGGRNLDQTKKYHAFPIIVGAGGYYNVGGFPFLEEVPEPE